MVVSAACAWQGFELKSVCFPCDRAMAERSASSRSSRIMGEKRFATRRELLQAGAGVPLALAASEARAMPTQTGQAQRPKLAVILTQYGASSHGVCYCTKFLEGKQYDD